MWTIMRDHAAAMLKTLDAYGPQTSGAGPAATRDLAVDGHEDSIRRLVVRSPAAAAPPPRTLRLALLDRDSGFLVVLANRLKDLASYRTFSAAMPPKRLLEMGLDAVVVDLEVLGTKPWEWLEKLGESEDPPGLVVCTGPSTPAQRVRAFRLGVDDWLTKPCHPEELIARVEAVVRQRRRLGSSQVEPALLGEVQIRSDQYQAYVGGASLKLTRREFQLIDVLASECDTVLPRATIYERVWGGTMPRDDRSVDVVVHKVRRKLLEASPLWRYIHTHLAVGYSFAPTDESVASSEALRLAAA
jgi:DNA-binding response OmpR family regulator